MPSFGRLFTPLSRRPCLKLSTGQVRHYPVCATPLSEPLEDVPAHESKTSSFSTDVQVTTLTNGLKVATLDSPSLTSKLGLFFNAGSRYETIHNSGISHMLRAGAFLSTSEYSGFHISRTMEDNGINLEASSTREHLVYSADCMKSNIDLVIQYLSSVARCPEFRQWELDDTVEKIELDLAMVNANPQIGLIEDLHKVAYRNALRNSIYCKSYNTGSFKTQMMLDYVQETFVGNKMTIVGIGVPHDELVSLSECYLSAIPPGNAVANEKPIYIGGEIHDEKPESLVHIALTTEGTSFDNKNYLALGILQRVLGVTPFIKWGSNTVSSRINKAVQEVTNGPFLVSTMNLNYSDSGLFGFYAAAQPKDATKVTKAVVDQFAKVSKGALAKDEIQRAKNQLKSSLLMCSESPSVQLEDIGTQVLSTGTYITPEEACMKIDKITVDDVVNAAKHAFGKKASLAIVGVSENLPHLDHLL